MNQIDTVKQRLADTPLRLKLYIGLGTSITGLLVVAIVTIYSNVANQQLVSRILTRQRQFADHASSINSGMLTIQNQAFGFYNTWSRTGSEDRSSFEEAQEAYLVPLQGQIDQIRDDVAEIEEMEPDEQTRTHLANILSSVDAYETSVSKMNEHMDSLGFSDSGEMSQIQSTMDELQGLLDDTDLASLKDAVLVIGQQWMNFLLYSDPTSARLTHDLIGQLTEQIAATGDDQLAPADKARLNALLEQYRDHLLVAEDHLTLVEQHREVLVDQSDLIRVSVGNLFEQQQVELDAALERLRRQQANATITVAGLTLLTFLVSASIVYIAAGQIIRPVQMLSEAADRISMGDLDMAMEVRSRDEIGELADSMERMRVSLKAAMDRLKKQG
jgi:HAMP domain-containing protein